MKSERQESDGQIIGYPQQYNDDIPCDNANLDKLESAKRACQGDIEMVLDGIYQQMGEKDLVNLFTNPLAFGQSMQDKVLAYIDSIVEGE